MGKWAAHVSESGGSLKWAFVSGTGVFCFLIPFHSKQCSFRAGVSSSLGSLKMAQTQLFPSGAGEG